MRIWIKVVVVHNEPILRRIPTNGHVRAPSVKVGTIALRMFNVRILKPCVQIERLVSSRNEHKCCSAQRIDHQVRIPFANTVRINIGQLKASDARKREQ